MKHPLTCLVLASLVLSPPGLAIAGALSPVAPTPSAEELAYAALRTKLDHLDDAEDKATIPEAELRLHDENSQVADRALLDYLQAYPQGVHRWQAVEWLVERRPYFFTALRSDPALTEEQLQAAAQVDGEKLGAWRQAAMAWIGRMEEGAAIDAAVLEGTQQALLEGDLEDATNACRRKQPVDLAALRDRVVQHIARFAADNKVRVLAYLYIELLQSAQPDQVLAAWKTFAQSPNARVREVAGAQVHWAEVKQAPIGLKFVGADGAPVDLAQFRGKIVLLDFWATWCPPCRAEIPNVVAVYQKYHGQGFEIVGVALEKSPEAEKLLAFTRGHGMTWPQLNGGKVFQSEAALNFGVYEIPHTVLLDRSGRVAAEDLRGPALESAVRGQLGL